MVRNLNENVQKKREEAYNSKSQSRAVSNVERHNLSLTIKSGSIGLRNIIRFSGALDIEFQVNADSYTEFLTNQLSKIRSSQMGLCQIVDKVLNQLAFQN